MGRRRKPPETPPPPPPLRPVTPRTIGTEGKQQQPPGRRMHVVEPRPLGPIAPRGDYGKFQDHPPVPKTNPKPTPKQPLGPRVIGPPAPRGEHGKMHYDKPEQPTHWYWRRLREPREPAEE